LKGRSGISREELPRKKAIVKKDWLKVREDVAAA